MAQKTAVGFTSRSAIATAFAQQSRAPLFNIPFELREKIYGYCELEDTRQVGLLEEDAYIEGERPAIPAFLLTCRAAFLEAKPQLTKHLRATAYFRPDVPLAWDITAASLGHPLNATNVVVGCQPTLEFDRAPIPVQFLNTRAVKFEWTREGLREDFIYKMDKPGAIGAGSLNAMLNQCLYFLDSMPRVQVVRLCGYYWQELPEKLREVLANRVAGPRVLVDSTEDVMEGRLTELANRWHGVLERVGERRPTWVAARQREKTERQRS